MGIGSQSYVYIAVAKEFLDCFAWFAQFKKPCGIGMAEIMKRLVMNINFNIDFF
jgi:hypothetical protein